MSSFGEELLPKKCVVEIRKVNATIGKPYLILLISEGSSIMVVSTGDVEFFKAYMKAANKLRKKSCECDSKTREILKLGIDEIYRRYNYPEEVYEEGKISYFYNKLCKLMEDAKKFQEPFLYSWKGRDGWLRNLRTIGCSFYETDDDRAYVSAKMDKDFVKSQITLWKKLPSAEKKYYGMNSYFSVSFNSYSTERKNKVFSLLALENNNLTKEKVEQLPYIHNIDDETIGILTNSFEDNIEMFSRQLALPYEDFSKEIDNVLGLDDFEKLDYLCERFNYPRAEIKKRVAECEFLKEMEIKNNIVEEDEELEKKSLIKRLFVFKRGRKK